MKGMIATWACPRRAACTRVHPLPPPPNLAEQKPGKQRSTAGVTDPCDPITGLPTSHTPWTEPGRRCSQRQQPLPAQVHCTRLNISNEVGARKVHLRHCVSSAVQGGGRVLNADGQCFPRMRFVGGTFSLSCCSPFHPSFCPFGQEGCTAMHPNPEEITEVFVAAVARIMCSMASTQPGLPGDEVSLTAYESTCRAATRLLRCSCWCEQHSRGDRSKHETVNQATVVLGRSPSWSFTIKEEDLVDHPLFSSAHDCFDECTAELASTSFLTASYELVLLSLSMNRW